MAMLHAQVQYLTVTDVLGQDCTGGPANISVPGLLPHDVVIYTLANDGSFYGGSAYWSAIIGTADTLTQTYLGDLTAFTFKLLIFRAF